MDAGTELDAGADGGTEPDAGADGGGTEADSGTGGEADAGTDGGPDAGPPDTSVRVRRLLRYHTAGGVEARPEDFTRNPVELFRLDGDALVAVSGAAGGPGEYVFPDVPFGPFYLKVGNVFVVTESRDVDLSINRLGRADAQQLEYAPTVYFELSGLEQWQENEEGQPPLQEDPSSRLELVSEELGLAGDISPSGVYGQAEVQGRVSFFPLTSEPMKRFEAARGDRAWVVQQSPNTLGELPDGGVQKYTAAARALHLPPLSHLSDTELGVSGTLQPLAWNELPLDWKVSAFAAHAAETHPAAVLRTSTFTLEPAAHGTHEGRIGYSGSLLQVDRPLGEPADAAGTLRYGNPYPSNWGLTAVASSAFGVQVQIGSERPLRLPAQLRVSDHASRLAEGPLTPRILPPRQLTLDGVEAYTSRPLAVGSHVIGWQPPSSGRADAYRLDLLRLDWRQQTGGRAAVQVARLWVGGSATSVRLPSGLLQAGQYYYLTVRAIQAEGHDVWGRPLMLTDRVVRADASTVTGLLSVPAP